MFAPVQRNVIHVHQTQNTVVCRARKGTTCRNQVNFAWISAQLAILFPSRHELARNNDYLQYTQAR